MSNSASYDYEATASTTPDSSLTLSQNASTGVGRICGALHFCAEEQPGWLTEWRLKAFAQPAGNVSSNGPRALPAH